MGLGWAMDVSLDISIVIVNWRAGEALHACLESVRQELDGASVRQAQTAGKRLSGECIVVDNGSEPGEMNALCRAFPETVVSVNTHNVGFARAANQGIQQARGRYVMLLNPDAWLTSGSVRHLVTCLDRQTEVGVVGPRIRNPDGSIQGSARAFPGLWTALFGRTSLLTRYFSGNPVSRYQMPALDPQLCQPQTVDWVSGACMLIRRQALEAVGGLDEQFFLYWEDADLCWRLHNMGWRIVYDPRVCVVHHVGGSSQHAAIRSLLAFHRSAYRLYRKHVTRSFWHPLNAVAICGLSIRALGLVGWIGVRSIRPKLNEVP